MAEHKTGTVELAGLLRRAIAAGNWQAGDRLPAERSLAVHYGVARGTLRGALDLLAGDGLIETRSGSGSYVRRDPGSDPQAIAPPSPAELMDTRLALEPHICRLAVLHARPEDLDALDACCVAMETAPDEPGFAQADAAFHLKLADSTHNTLLIWIMAHVNAVRGHEQWTQVRRLTLTDAMAATYNAEHRTILTALRARDADRAAAAMHDHLETARLSLAHGA